MNEKTIVKEMVQDILEHPGYEVSEDTKKWESTRPLLFVVWIDSDMGSGNPDWEMNSPPKPLALALDEAKEVRDQGWPTQILPEGKTPRADGLFSNPRTDP